jgi:hypothetical protein
LEAGVRRRSAHAPPDLYAACLVLPIIHNSSQDSIAGKPRKQPVILTIPLSAKVASISGTSPPCGAATPDRLSNDPKKMRLVRENRLI